MPSLPAFDVDKNVCHNPHVIILGAEASMAAAPNGDKHGRRLPSLQNVADIIGITDLIDRSQSKYGTLGSGRWPLGFLISPICVRGCQGGLFRTRH
jgi:hypothetical protein